MPVYASRVSVTVPVKAKTESGESIIVGHRPLEVMFDVVKAKSMNNAEVKVKKEAKRYWEWQWDGDIQDDIPAPSIIATCRLDDSGVPVATNFPLPCTAAPRVVSTSGGKKKQVKKVGFRPPPKVDTPAPAPKPAPIFNLKDPFTEEIISTVFIQPK